MARSFDDDHERRDGWYDPRITPLNRMPPAPRPGPESDLLLSQLIRQMRRFGLGERVLKTALAAGLSWQLATLIPGNDHPYLAPLSAVLLMQLTIAQSVDLAIQRNIGIAIGVIVAVASFALFGVHAWSVSLVVLISLAAGIQLRLGQQAVQQVAVSALIVLLAGSVTGTFEYAFRRILDSIIGASVALVLNWLVVPPIHIAPASKAIERMAQDLSLALADLAVSLRSGMTRTRAEAHLKSARALATSLAAANVALGQAEQSLRYNRFARGRHDEMARLQNASRALEHGAIQTRVLARSMVTAFEENAADWIQPDQFGRSLADLLGRNAALVRYVGGRGGIRPELAITTELHESMLAYWQARADPGWLYAGEVLAMTERMAKELNAAIDAGDTRP
jgi:uncharacterized membrane protein YgaE (UPF0421/DUF939 family)